nr:MULTISPECIES: hypothetical protein [unclassified Rhizobium]
MQILELRLGVEIQAAALAATRRTPEAQPRINKEHAAMVPFARGHSGYCE